MTMDRAVIVAAACVTLLASGGCFSRVKTSEQADVAGAALDRRELAEATISQWSNLSALSAKRLIEEYGTPDEVFADHLVWIDNSPWRRTVVVNVRPGFITLGAGDVGVVEQAVNYRLTPKQAVDVAAFDGRVAFDPRSGRLSSRADKEEHNFLRLNLADDVAAGRLSPEAARKSYASIVSFEEAGKNSPYVLGLRFAVAP
jgi:hypothetical protein